MPSPPPPLIVHSLVSLTGVLSEATHISGHAHGSKWDATLLGLLCRKRSRLLSLTLRCLAVSSPQITEDDNYVLAEEPIFTRAATSVHDTYSQVGRTDTSKAHHSNTWPYKSGAVFSPFMDVGCVCNSCVSAADPAGLPLLNDWQNGDHLSLMQGSEVWINAPYENFIFIFNLKKKPHLSFAQGCLKIILKNEANYCIFP